LSRKSDDNDSTSRFIFSATDSGNSIVIYVPDGARQSLPLSNVVVTVRSANSISAVELSTMCDSGQSQTISWSAFPAWEQRRKRTIRVDVTGVCKSGAVIRGSAFIGNYLLLSSEPGHRSAWRAAIAILDSEGVPELADISALFTLANEVLDLPSAPASSSSRAQNERPEPSGELIPIWPPTADVQKLQQRFGRAAGGQLKWFQEILSTFLRRGIEEERPESQSRSHDQEDEGDDDDDSSMSEAQRLKRQEQDASIATRVWNRAKQEYDSLLSKLHELEPTTENAANVWPVAIFTFLAVMGLVAIAIRKTPKPEWKLEVNFLIDDFIRTMFQHRQQSGDYWPPASSRYRNDDFPALARDLKQNFHYHMHHLLGPIVIALFADQMMRERPYEFRPKWEERFRQFWNAELASQSDLCDYCFDIWRKFFLGETRSSDQGAFRTAVEQLRVIATALPT